MAHLLEAHLPVGTEVLHLEGEAMAAMVAVVGTGEAGQWTMTATFLGPIIHGLDLHQGEEEEEAAAAAAAEDRIHTHDHLPEHRLLDAGDRLRRQTEVHQDIEGEEAQATARKALTAGAEAGREVEDEMIAAGGEVQVVDLQAASMGNVSGYCVGAGRTRVSWKASKEMHGSFGPQSRGTSKSISLKKDRRSGRRKEKGALIFVPRGDGAFPHLTCPCSVDPSIHGA